MNIPSNMRLAFFYTFLIVSFTIYGQDKERASETISDLCSDELAGRGYIDHGAPKAASYIAEKFKELGLERVSDTYKQQFSLGVNTVAVAKINVDKTDLKPGLDFLVKENSGSVSGTFPVFYVSSKMLRSKKLGRKVKKAAKKGYIPVISIYDSKNKVVADNVEAMKKCNSSITIVYLTDKLTWSVGREQKKGCEIFLVDSIFSGFAKTITLDIQATFIENYATSNVIGQVKGTVYPDSVIIFCGHYDHLGKMGDAIFYGANDNASGIAMLIDMASYFVTQPQKYSIIFIAFGAEEAGLVGSLHYVKNPLIPLSKTKFVFNMDLMGSGEEGATVVNATVFKSHFKKLTDINDKKQYLPVIKSRGKAANSDHYFFTEVGVPSFFMYTLGKYKFYHSPLDNSDNLKLNVYYDRTYSLIKDFILELTN